jgi:hypothetical protein
MKKVGTSSKWRIQKYGEASARQFETACLGRVYRHHCAPLAAVDFWKVFARGAVYRAQVSEARCFHDLCRSRREKNNDNFGAGEVLT